MDSGTQSGQLDHGQEEKGESAEQSFGPELQNEIRSSKTNLEMPPIHEPREEVRDSSSTPPETAEADLERGEDPQYQAIRKETDEGKLDDRDLSRTVSTVSIAESLSLPHEIIFVSIICLAQFMTQVCPFRPQSSHILDPY